MIHKMLVGLVVSSALFAGSENLVPSFSDFDTNRDGKVTKGEFETVLEQRVKKQRDTTKIENNIDQKPSFQAMDSNKDSYVDVVEFSEYKAKFRAKSREQTLD